MAAIMLNKRFNRHRTGALAVFVMYASLAVLYILVGAAVLVFQQYWIEVPTHFKITFGVMCLGYGLFRLYRAWTAYREDTVESE